jgi:hypothetical protein
MTNYLLSTTVVPNGANGIWEIQQISASAVKVNLTQNWVSAVGHESTASLMSELLNIGIPVNRVPISCCWPGDKLFCFKLKSRAPEGVVLDREQIERMGYEWLVMTYHGTLGAALDAHHKSITDYIMAVRCHPGF